MHGDAANGVSAIDKPDSRMHGDAANGVSAIDQPDSRMHGDAAKAVSANGEPDIRMHGDTAKAVNANGEPVMHMPGTANSVAQSDIHKHGEAAQMSAIDKPQKNMDQAKKKLKQAALVFDGKTSSSRPPIFKRPAARSTPEQPTAPNSNVST